MDLQTAMRNCGFLEASAGSRNYVRSLNGMPFHQDAFEMLFGRSAQLLVEAMEQYIIADIDKTGEVVKKPKLRQVILSRFHLRIKKTAKKGAFELTG